ncbi:TerC family protein [Aureimonas leprariae]|uniref:TerC family protein n=1 Tax=Plantimonas leprariae TaxID=2615207 RepID=A0A7V7PSY1_9HYPH|nr:TerC family protein [Aureimonas leprariae]KAB0682559.1 TerC family protein [Aureimonas leprariae]
MDFLTVDSLTALLQIVMIDLVLAGDNAIVIGLAAAGLPKEQRARAILVGIIAATVLRIVFAATTQWLLGFGGALLVAGGLLLLYVCWKMWRELRQPQHDPDAEIAEAEGRAGRKTLGQAVWQIVVADVSMSLDNVLAVAGAAGEHLWVLIVGLVLSIGLMGLAASLIAGLLQRYRWIAYVGLAIILYVAVKMLLEGVEQLRPGTFAFLH